MDWESIFAISPGRINTALLSGATSLSPAFSDELWPFSNSLFTMRRQGKSANAFLTRPSSHPNTTIVSSTFESKAASTTRLIIGFPWTSARSLFRPSIRVDLPAAKTMIVIVIPRYLSLEHWEELCFTGLCKNLAVFENYRSSEHGHCGPSLQPPAFIRRPTNFVVKVAASNLTSNL